MNTAVPPIVKASERLLVDIEQAVRRFDRYHRYAIGTDLRAKAMQVYDLAQRAWRDRQHQARWVAQLVWAIDELRHRLQAAKLLRATPSFCQFEHLARQISELGKQAGGWHRHLNTPKGQDAQGRQAVAQRAQKLSTRATPAGVNP
ncbi:four helix bundle protein [Luteimonas notoginsengisoli]|uniref:Four helix bundle protein n=1 Tax=Luteimonas notoginsengisoli TaxID=1578200 RepID=A0ABV7UPY2_9GAMM